MLFLRSAQQKYAEFFGHRRLASRSMTPVSPEDKRLLLQYRRPPWQHLATKSLHTQAARRDRREADVRKMLEESSLKKAERVMRHKAVECETYQQEQERTGGLTCPPVPVRLVELRDDPRQKKRKLGDATSGTIARAVAKGQACMALTEQQGLSGSTSGMHLP